VSCDEVVDDAVVFDAASDEPARLVLASDAASDEPVVVVIVVVHSVVSQQWVLDSEEKAAMNENVAGKGPYVFTT
jgi:hypothetical protein